jgi:hypothetical protein
MSELQKWASARYADAVISAFSGSGETANSCTFTTSISTNSSLSYTSTNSSCWYTQWSSVIPTRALSQWQIEGIKRLNKVLSLPENWDGYGSRPPTQAAANTAMDLIISINIDDLVPLRVVPVSGGGIQLEWETSTRALELEILDGGTIEYLKTEDGTPVDEGHMHRIDQVRPLLSWLISSQPVLIAA